MSSDLGRLLISVPHLIPERHPLETQYRLLHRLHDCFARGWRDPELLYLGGRFATALGLERTARRFLGPLAVALHNGNTPTAPFFPVALLLIHVMEEGERREAARKALYFLAGESPMLTNILRRTGNDPGSKLPRRSPKRVLRDIERNKDKAGRRIAEVFLPAARNRKTEDEAALLIQLAERAKEKYHEGHLEEARHTLEEMLLIEGNQPGVLRNLVSVCEKSGDESSAARYRRRTVEALLYRVVAGDAAEEARLELLEFYSDEAGKADHEMGRLRASGELFEHPDLLMRWTEAHGALVWLDAILRPDSATKGHLALRHPWMRRFHPRFAGTMGTVTGVPARWHGRGQSTLPFDPARRLLIGALQLTMQPRSRMRERQRWYAALDCLTELAAHLPIRPIFDEARSLLEKGRTDPAPFRTSLSRVFRPSLARLCGRSIENADWEGLIERLDSPYVFEKLDPSLRLVLALALARQSEYGRAFDLACRTVRTLTPEDLDEQERLRALWQAILRRSIHLAALQSPEEGVPRLRAQLQRIANIEPSRTFRDEGLNLLDREQAAINERMLVTQTVTDCYRMASEGRIGTLEERLDKFPARSVELMALRDRLLPVIVQARQTRELKTRFEGLTREVDTHMRSGQFDSARRVANTLTVHDERTKALRRALLERIDAAEEKAVVRQRVDAAAAHVEKLIAEGRFGEAREKAGELVDGPAALDAEREALFARIDDAEQDAALRKQIAGVRQEVEELARMGEPDEARFLVDELPDEPGRMAAAKAELFKLIREIDEAIRLEARFSQIEGLIGKLCSEGRHEEARVHVRNLPDASEDHTRRKRRMLQRIEDAEENTTAGGEARRIVEATRALMSRGQFMPAMQMLSNMPPSPPENREMRKRLMAEIKQEEIAWQRAEEENDRLVQQLISKGIDVGQVAKIARQKDVNPNNPREYNRLLRRLVEKAD